LTTETYAPIHSPKKHSKENELDKTLQEKHKDKGH